MSRNFNELRVERDAKRNRRTPAGWLRRRSLAGRNARYTWGHPWIMPGHYWRQVKWFGQRGRRGWADLDSWGLDDYLLRWLPDAMAHVRENAYSHPIDLTFDEWDAMIQKIEDGLRAGARYYGVGDDLSGYGDEELLPEFTEAWRLLGERFPSN